MGLHSDLRNWENYLIKMRQGTPNFGENNEITPFGLAHQTIVNCFYLLTQLQYVISLHNFNMPLYVSASHWSGLIAFICHISRCSTSISLSCGPAINFFENLLLFRWWGISSPRHSMGERSGYATWSMLNG